MNTSICNKIKTRKKPKDVFYTPKELAKEHIDYLRTSERKNFIYHYPFPGD